MARIERFMARVLVIAASAGCVATAHAQPPCPAGQVLGATVTVGGVGAGTLTIRPGGNGGIAETFLGASVPIRVCLTCNGIPLVGVPASQIRVASPGVNFCPSPDANIADTPTNVAGCAEFTGTICGGGCAQQLDIFVAGTFVGSAPVRINSTDIGTSSPGFVDAADLARLASLLGNPAAYTFCADFNEDGSIDAADIAYFAAALGASQCTAVCP